MKPVRLFRPLTALLPALLLLAACGDDDPKPAAPDQAPVKVYHAAAAANVALTAFVADKQVAQLNYGQSSDYQTVNAGSPALRVNNGTQVVATQAVTVSKDQNHSVFLYSPTASIGSAALLSVTDDLTAPVSGQAKVRVVHLAVGAASPVRLTAPSPVPGSLGTDISPDVAFGTASGFFALNAGATNLTITTTGSSRAQLLAVGDGSGSGSGTKNYESGKIYTIIVRGIAGAGVPAAQAPQAVIVQNN